jgi:hypothetical protein
MPEANAAPAEKAPAQKVITELKVSGHLMTLDPGLFCIVQMPSRPSEAGSGLPGVRISHPPGPASRPEAVSISTFRPDGWLLTGGDAALVRVLGGPAQVLVTIYQSPVSKDNAPSLQVLRLLEPIPGAVAAGAGAPVARRAPAPGPAAPGAPAPVAASGPAPTVMEMVAHIQERGDVGAMIGDWLGEKGSKRWIEGFGVAPTRMIGPKDIEYQAVLGRGWLSPWVEGGQFCGSRGMALPILGLRLRLRGEAAEAFEVAYSATFTDGTEVGPVGAGEECEAESLAPIEAFQIVVRPRGAASMPVAAAKPAPETEAPPLAARAKPTTAKPAAKPAVKSKAPAAGRKPASPPARRR